MFDVKNVSDYLQSPKYRHWEQVKRIVRYLAGTRDCVHKIDVNSEVIAVKSVDEDSLVGWSDTDFAGDVESRRSTFFVQCSDWMEQSFTHIRVNIR